MKAIGMCVLGLVAGASLVGCGTKDSAEVTLRLGESIEITIDNPEGRKSGVIEYGVENDGPGTIEVRVSGSSKRTRLTPDGEFDSRTEFKGDAKSKDFPRTVTIRLVDGDEAEIEWEGSVSRGWTMKRRD